MNTVIVLFWLLVSPTGEGHLMVQPEPGQEQCLKEAQLMSQESEAAIKSGDIMNYWGACAPIDLTAASKNKKGSI